MVYGTRCSVVRRKPHFASVIFFLLFELAPIFLSIHILEDANATTAPRKSPSPAELVCSALICSLEFFFFYQLTQTLTMAMDGASASTDFDDDYSPSSTVIKFDRPIPLLRGPLPASPSDDPSAGPYVLAFRDSQAWASSFIACERKIVQQCEEGARIGCAINASTKCKPPWWNYLLGPKPKPSDLKERELCEEREMAECFAAAKEKCVGFARDKCMVPFRNARIKVREEGVSNKREAVELIRWASLPERSLWLTSLMGSECLIGGEFGMTNCRACELLGSDDCVQCVLGERQQGTKN